MIDHTTLLSLLEYCPKTGRFRWLVDRTAGIKAGDLAGCKNKDGYIVISVLGRQYPAHRLAWFYMFGEWALVDHRDTVGDNNRSDNIRKATHQQNCRNRSNQRGRLHPKGVYFRASRKRWQACITIDGRVIFLGSFKTETEGHAAYAAAAERYFGEFARAA